jgi:hypothetical protein
LGHAASLAELVLRGKKRVEVGLGRRLSKRDLVNGEKRLKHIENDIVLGIKIVQRSIPTDPKRWRLSLYC